ncbi:hypothetical protein [Bacillus sp. IBL03825]|uniref:hypothetical protein n=1 Tax=Bacillus sp. IBL03825 TaxID=2953580 RepID=UPI002157339F|nr:hypothetical protein [Bacillus sp. IBL03825]MCR6850465.1 hypothetical protein [Bacillus sp. IBL03825]
MTTIDIVELFGNYANKWSEKQGGGENNISLILPNYEYYAVQDYFKNIEFSEPTSPVKTEIKLASETYSNTGTTPKEINIEMSGDVNYLGKWTLDNGASTFGKNLVDIFPSNDPINVDKSSFSLRVGESTTRKNLVNWEFNYPHVIRPRFKITANLMVKMNVIKRTFKVARDLSGYVAVLLKKPNGSVQISFHHVAAILQRYYSPYFKIDGVDVTLFNNGSFEGTYFTEPYIHVVASSLDIPNLTEEYNLYFPNNSGMIIEEIPQQTDGDLCGN